MSGPCPLVLLVEDDADTAELYQALLMGEGMRVVRCQDKAEAESWWQSSGLSPDLMVLDIGLPDGNGLDLFDYLSRRQEKKVPPVLVLSAHGGPAMPRQCRQVGAAAFLDKLCDMDRFIPTVQSLVGF